MFKSIEGAAYCEIRLVISILKSRIVLPSEVHHKICQVYGENSMGDGMFGKCVQMFNEGRGERARLGAKWASNFVK